MNRIRQGWDALRRGRRSGVSLVIALCAVAVFIGLSLSIVYSSSMLLSRANRKIGRERCYQLAQSFAQVLDSELTAYNTERTDLGGADDKWPQTADGSRTFYQYANSVLENLDAYDADDPEHTTYYYSAGDEDDDYGKVTVMLRKQNTDSEQNPADRTGCFPYAEKDRQTAEISAQTFIRYQLSVSVRVEKGADSFTYTTEYYRRDLRNNALTGRAGLLDLYLVRAAAGRAVYLIMFMDDRSTLGGGFRIVRRKSGCGECRHCDIARQYERQSSMQSACHFASPFHKKSGPPWDGQRLVISF